MESAQTALKWHDMVWKDETSRPIISGLYAVMVRGDSEYCEGHLVYSFDDYMTFATFDDDDEGCQRFNGEHDEEAEVMFAWYGPIIIPGYCQ